MSLLNTLRFILTHPLNEHSKTRALGRFVGWQLRSRLMPGPVTIDFVNGSRLIVNRGRHGATGNLYTRLHEFAEMGFVLHALRAGEVFVDVGANIGAYTTLAASIPGTRCIAFEPASDTFDMLTANICLNDFSTRVRAYQFALGDSDGETAFTVGQDTGNHVVGDADEGARKTSIPLRKLDTVLDGEIPSVMKIDVEGFELPVLKGAKAALADPRLFAVILEMNGSGARYGIIDDKLDQFMLDYSFVAKYYDPITRSLIPVPTVNRSGNRIYVRGIESVQKRLREAPAFSVAGGQRV